MPLFQTNLIFSLQILFSKLHLILEASLTPAKLKLLFISAQIIVFPLGSHTNEKYLLRGRMGKNIVINK